MTLAHGTSVQISPADIKELQEAKHMLENPGLTVKLTNLIGTPIEKGLEMLPDTWRGKVTGATTDALNACLRAALKTMNSDSAESYPWWHKAAVVTSGAVGGAFGVSALLLELPLSTSIMMRSIADIGRSHGENLATLESQLNCLMVFALGGRNKADDAGNSSYFVTRLALARAVTEAVEVTAGKAIVDEAAPAILRLIAMVAARFQVQVSEKAAAQLVPVIGAIGGGMVNYMFMDHFQDMSNGHFAVRRLERKYGQAIIQDAYQTLPA